MAKDMWLKLKRWKKTSNYNPEMTKAHITGFCQKYSVLKKNNTIYNLNIARQKTSKKMAKTPMAGLFAIKDDKNSYDRFVCP